MTSNADFNPHPRLPFFGSIFAEGELTPEATVKHFLMVRRVGSRQVSRQSIEEQGRIVAMSLKTLRELI